MKYDGAVMITASHLPYNRNGFKFFDNKAGFEKKEITDLLKQAANEAAKGSLEEQADFPRDKRQAETFAIDILEKGLKHDSSLTQKVSTLISSKTSSLSNSLQIVVEFNFGCLAAAPASHTDISNVCLKFSGEVVMNAAAVQQWFKWLLQVNFMPIYSNHLQEIIKKGVDSHKNYDRPLEGFKIAVDAGNGSGGFLATDVLAPLGADIAGN